MVNFQTNEDDKIYISLTIMDKSATDEQMEAGCRYALGHMQIYVSKSLHELFQHVGYLDPSEPSELGSELAQMFEFRCYVSGESSSNGRFWATQTLRSDEMTIGIWPTFN